MCKFAFLTECKQAITSLVQAVCPGMGLLIRVKSGCETIVFAARCLMLSGQKYPRQKPPRHKAPDKNPLDKKPLSKTPQTKHSFQKFYHVC